MEVVGKWKRRMLITALMVVNLVLSVSSTLNYIFRKCSFENLGTIFEKLIDI